MQAARRLYLYVMSGITLGVIAYGLVLLLRVFFHGFFPDPFIEEYGGEYDGGRQQLSQAIAMLGVGVPVWAVHWRLVQRGLREGRPERDEERGSTLRAIYLTGILMISLVVWVTSAASVLQWFATDLLKVVPEFSYQDPLGAATSGVTAFAIWLYHGLVRRGDLAAGPVSGPAAWVPRLYLYGVSIGSGYVVLTVVSNVVSSVIWGNLGGEDQYAAFSLVQQVVTGVAWVLVWFGHWTYANRLVRDDGWRGTEERVSRTRVGAFVAIVVFAAGMTLIGLVSALNVVVGAILPREPGQNFDGVPNVEFEASAVVVALITAGLWGAVWWTHNRALKREPAAADPLRALHQERLVGHGVAAAALAIGATGAGWLLGYLIDLVFGHQTAFDYPSWELAQFIPLALVGLVAWAWFWRGIVARRRADPAGEAHSTIRRTFLYLTLGVALVAAISTAAVILYRFVGIVVGAGLGGDLASELATPLGSLIAAGFVLAYHGLALRADQRLVPAPGAPAPEALPIEAVPAEAAPVDPATAEQRRSFALTGPEGADLDAALAAARAALPPGIELVSAED